MGQGATKAIFADAKSANRGAKSDNFLISENENRKSDNKNRIP